MPRAVFLVTGTSFLLAIISTPPIKATVTFFVYTIWAVVWAKHVTSRPIVAIVTVTNMVSCWCAKFAGFLTSNTHPSLLADALRCFIVRNGWGTRTTSITVRITGAVWNVACSTWPPWNTCTFKRRSVTASVVTTVKWPPRTACNFTDVSFVSQDFIADTLVIHALSIQRAFNITARTRKTRVANATWWVTIIRSIDTRKFTHNTGPIRLAVAPSWVRITAASMARTNGFPWTIGRAAIVPSPTLSANTFLSVHATKAVIGTGALAWASWQFTVFSHMSNTFFLATITFVVYTFSKSGALTLASAPRKARITYADTIFGVTTDTRIVTSWTHPALNAVRAFRSHTISRVAVSTTKTVWNARTVREMAANTRPPWEKFQVNYLIKITFPIEQERRYTSVGCLFLTKGQHYNNCLMIPFAGLQIISYVYAPFLSMKLLPKCLLRVFFSFLLPFDDEEDYLTVQVILISNRNKNNRISNRRDKRAKTCRQWGIKKDES